MSLRLKLLLLAFATLVLPWAGCRYAQEMETALREGERNSLASVAQTIAASLQGRRDLLYREVSSRTVTRVAPASEDNTDPASQADTDSTDVSEPTDASESKADSTPVRSPYDLEPLVLPAAPFLDG